MKCEICGLRDAVIHIRQIQKDLVHELHICEECAQEKGLIREEDTELPIANLLSGLLEGKDVTGATEGKDVCPRCGMKATEFRKQGKLGCPECFQAFEKDVRAIVSQMAARPRHTGRLPRAVAAEITPSEKGEGLREELRIAVEREEYELAAQIRDRLRELESDV
ncbi:MAG TPA: UvrB/UvrC motif-containing protein [Spirochaetia bacterium]